LRPGGKVIERFLASAAYNGGSDAARADEYQKQHSDTDDDNHLLASLTVVNLSYSIKPLRKLA